MTTTHEQPLGEREPTAHPDAGLLSPVRAGTPVEAAVGDAAWLQAMLDAEAALARAQARCGTVPAWAAAAITAAARAERLDVRQVALAARETANPVVPLIAALTAAVARDAPHAVEYVHRGSTSQDIFDTGAMLVAARALRLITADLRTVAGTLAPLAAEHRDTVMAGRTLALHAVPTTFGLKAAGWRQLVLDAVERLERVLGEGLPVSLGGAAGTLAGYAPYGGGGRPAAADTDPAGLLDTLLPAFAAETQLAVPALPWHALRTPVADLGAALACTTGALGKIAADVLVLARTEIGEVAESAAEGRGVSSAMPHKRNPVLATLIRSAALQVPALATVLAQCLPAEDERSAGVWHAEWQPLRECLRLTGGAAHTAVELVRGLTVRPERMRANLAATGGQLVSERIAAALAPHLGRAAAGQLLAAASLRAADTARPLAEILAEHPDVQRLFTPRALARLLDPADYTGAAAALVDRALKTPK
ncbi:3-carboxy-cis,cis-muconate cycloisomerase [Streptomyces sp. MNU76]|uniref:3-carboxy-cis,cis-muconate cycloisomerase n=1 Tax=Streptomyces sp. MNU76 TaxID=2560026 RepID=UPI001E451657|nr:3-carboxy-cis,cis-muconate cycloisomerase [Streptomyces sp. MNU76]MCC9711593.1 3-carboxy-cis,cis-muconate cycloisomerase [Streptomyces sp. MNU76]